MQSNKQLLWVAGEPRKVFQGLFLLGWAWNRSREIAEFPQVHTGTTGIRIKPKQSEKTHRSHLLWVCSPLHELCSHYTQDKEESQQTTTQERMSSWPHWDSAWRSGCCCSSCCCCFPEFHIATAWREGKRGGQWVFLRVEGSDVIARLVSAPAYFGVTPSSLAELYVSIKNKHVRVMPTPIWGTSLLLLKTTKREMVWKPPLTGSQRQRKLEPWEIK